MTEEWGRFRIATGVVVVRSDAVAIRSTPRAFAAGQYDRLRNAGLAVRAKALGELCGFLLTPLLLVWLIVRIANLGVDVLAFSQLISLCALVYTTWRRHRRETVVPFDDVERLTIREGNRRLEIEYDAGDGVASVFPGDPRTLTHVFRSDDDVREATELFRLRDVEFDDGEDPPTETVSRVETRRGVCFCEGCGSQVSPNDRRCPACDDELRYEAVESA